LRWVCLESGLVLGGGWDFVFGGELMEVIGFALSLSLVQFGLICPFTDFLQKCFYFIDEFAAFVGQVPDSISVVVGDPRGAVYYFLLLVVV
jgi:hypothetical protein